MLFLGFHSKGCRCFFLKAAIYFIFQHKNEVHAGYFGSCEEQQYAQDS